MAELAGLIRKYKGRFILSRNCRKLLAEGGMAAIYPLLFRAFVEQYNWAYGDRHVAIDFIQHSFLFSLYLLNRYGDDSQSSLFYEDCFLNAFPMVVSEVEPQPHWSPEQQSALFTPCALWCVMPIFWGWPEWNLWRLKSRM